MVTLAWYLLALAPIAAILYVVWAHRRKTAERAAQSSKRFAQFFGTADRGTAANVAPLEATAVSPTNSPPGGTPEARGAGSYVRRSRLLSAQQLRLRELIESGLPGHAVFCQVSLAAVIDIAGLPEGREREQRRRALAQQTVDCVVCDPALAVTAVVDLEAGGDSAEARFKAQCLKAAGVRYLRCNPLELPRREDVMSWLTGARGAVAES